MIVLIIIFANLMSRKIITRISAQQFERIICSDWKRYDDTKNIHEPFEIYNCIMRIQTIRQTRAYTSEQTRVRTLKVMVATQNITRRITVIDLFIWTIVLENGRKSIKTALTQNNYSTRKNHHNRCLKLAWPMIVSLPADKFIAIHKCIEWIIYRLCGC